MANAPKRTGSYPKVDRFKQLKGMVRLEDFYERFTPNILRKRGHNLWGLCPFPDHNEATPSFKMRKGRHAHAFRVGMRSAERFSISTALPMSRLIPSKIRRRASGRVLASRGQGTIR